MSANPRADAATTIVLEAQNDALRRAIRAHEANGRLVARAAELGLDVPSAPMTMAIITAVVAAENGLTVADLKSRSKRYVISHARQEAMWRMRQERWSTGKHRWSLPQIGAFFGMDHTTALHAVRAVERRQAAAERGLA
jgi:chromosomal replication initiation ATPase DnaA